MKSSLQNFVDGLKLDYKKKYVNDECIIDLPNDAEFSNVFTQFCNNDEFTLQEGSISTEDNLMYIFYTDWFEIRFTADFVKNIYRITIGER